eukprot:1138337-Pelagomonas_calceolata.AAC.2
MPSEREGWSPYCKSSNIDETHFSLACRPTSTSVLPGIELSVFEWCVCLRDVCAQGCAWSFCASLEGARLTFVGHNQVYQRLHDQGCERQTVPPTPDRIV